jgi:hypothetical protein
LRFAIAFGVHAQSKTSAIEPQLKQAMAQTWWSLHNLESLLSSMTGRPCMLRSDDITTPFPSEIEDELRQQTCTNISALSFADAQVRLAVITQKVQSLLYTKRKTARSWAQTHAIISSMMSELDEWSSEAMVEHLEEPHTVAEHEMQQTMLRKQYYRTKILVTRPSLRRVERCFETGVDDLTPFDQEVAETCVQTAQDVASLLPEEVNLKLVYEKGPWWIVVHNSELEYQARQRFVCSPDAVMQSLAVLLVGISCRTYFELSYSNSVAAVKKLVTWLLCMRETNDMAKRGYQVIYSIVRADNLADPFMWKDIVGFLPSHEVTQPAQGQTQMSAQVYQTWAGEEQPLQRLFGFQDAGDFASYDVRPV